MISSSKSVARLALAVCTFSGLSALADSHHGHPVLGMPAPRPPVVVGLPVRPPTPRPIGLPVPPHPRPVGLPVPPRPIGFPTGIVAPPPRPIGLPTGIVAPRPPRPIGFPIGIIAPHSERYSLTCNDLQGRAQEINELSLNLVRNGAQSFRAEGFVVYTDGGSDSIDSVAFGEIGNQIDLRIQDVGDIRVENGALGALRPFHQGALTIFGRTDRHGLGCTLVRR